MKSKITCVYQHRRLDNNEIFYIGIGSKKRAYSKSANRRNIWWIRIINKTDYEVEILSNNLTWQNAQQTEIELIKLYGRRDLGLGTLVNLTDGGEGTIGRILTKEQCEDISNRMKGHIVTEETRKKLSISNKGFGKNRIITEETRKKMSNSQKGRVVSEENKLKISEWTSKKIINIETNIIYNSIKEASRLLNKSPYTIYRYLNNIGKPKIELKYYKYE